jgi:hypothetical protein
MAPEYKANQRVRKKAQSKIGVMSLRRSSCFAQDFWYHEPTCMYFSRREPSGDFQNGVAEISAMFSTSYL